MQQERLQSRGSHSVDLTIDPFHYPGDLLTTARDGSPGILSQPLARRRQGEVGVILLEQRSRRREKKDVIWEPAEAAAQQMDRHPFERYGISTDI